MSEVDVRIEDVWKQYRLGTHRGAGTFWALKGLRLDVARGTCMGVIGRNGAGKSTLMKLLAGITAPTRGAITINGRVAALIEVGSGFHPELTGRENVFLSGSILGMRRREIAQKLSSIVEFAGVEAFIDTPVKWYSSGMYVRLGFSVAAHLEPDILLVDEVLAVGDAEFQTRCVRRLNQLRQQGVTIIFISHNLTAVEQMCDVAVLLEAGELAALGRPSDVVSVYHRRLTTAEASSEAYTAMAREGVLKLTNLTAHDPHNPESLTGRTGSPLVVAVRFMAARRLEGIVFELTYYSADGQTLIASARTGGQNGDGIGVDAPGGVVEFRCSVLPLPPGTYYLSAVARQATTGHVIDWWDGGTMLHVEPGAPLQGQMYVPHEWSVAAARIE
jgi:ABC-type polysaccharide/polyol phosphate transport system ATPase subunit